MMMLMMAMPVMKEMKTKMARKQLEKA